MPRLSSARRLAYTFLGLPYWERIKISHHLGLIEHGDGELEDVELFSKIFSRAVKKRLLKKLWQQVMGSDEDNPYGGK